MINVRNNLNTAFFKKLPLVLGTSLVILPLMGLSQEASQDRSEPATTIEEVVVTGTRSVIRTSIDLKRNADTIVDGLSAEEIGDLPALSIGEALETLTGASSHIEQGGATEISIRGLGPYLGSTVINGREATNGSGDRSVNFSQFPSELFNKLAIYKTQEASFIEGGVSGQIHLDTLRPLDYGKTRTQVGLKLAYNPDNQELNIKERGIGTRLTLSHIDQIELSNGNELGYSFGYQRNQTTNPEQEYRTTSGFASCAIANLNASSNCGSSGRNNLDTTIDPATGVAPDANTPFVFVPSARTFRQNITDDDRKSFFGAVQFRTERMNINVDVEYSDRVFTEERNDLSFTDSREVDPNGLNATPLGTILAYSNSNGRLETSSQYQERLEEYLGGGINVEYEVNDRLTLSFDASYSDTSRRENIYQTRLRSAPEPTLPITTNSANLSTAASYVLPGVGSQVPLITITNFDVTNPNLFYDDPRTRVDLNQARDNNITAFRGGFEYQTELGMIKSLEGGLRYSELEFISFPRIRREFDSDNEFRGVLENISAFAANQACRNSVFPENGFLSDVSGGQNLITNVDANGNVIASGTGSSYATFDALCLIRELVGEVPAIPAPEQNVNNVNVEEQTIAGYVQANFEGEISDYPVRGNFGVRVVNTTVDSIGLRGDFMSSTDNSGTVTIAPTGDFTSVSGGNDYTEILPSVNLIVDLQDDVLLRAAVYRGLSRPDPADLGFGRSFTVDSDENAPDSIEDFAGRATATGNPFLEPLTSWNFDIAAEWYPNEDSILGLGFYYKSFQGGFESVRQQEQIIIDGTPIATFVSTTGTDEDTSTIYGFEFNAAHSFSYLPYPFDGLGAKVSYNYANSDFEFEDGNFGESNHQ